MTPRLATAFFISLALSGGALAQYIKPQSTPDAANKKQVNSQQVSRTSNGKPAPIKSNNPDRLEFSGGPAVIVVPDKR